MPTKNKKLLYIPLFAIVDRSGFVALPNLTASEVNKPAFRIALAHSTSNANIRALTIGEEFQLPIMLLRFFLRTVRTSLQSPALLGFGSDVKISFFECNSLSILLEDFKTKERSAMNTEITIIATVAISRKDDISWMNVLLAAKRSKEKHGSPKKPRSDSSFEYL